MQKRYNWQMVNYPKRENNKTGLIIWPLAIILLFISGCATSKKESRVIPPVRTDVKKLSSIILSANKVSYCQAELIWQTNIDNATGYEIEWRFKDKDFTLFKTENRNATHSQIEKLKPNTIYYFRIRAVYKKSFSIYSNVVQIILSYADKWDSVNVLPSLQNINTWVYAGEFFILFANPSKLDAPNRIKGYIYNIETDKKHDITLRNAPFNASDYSAIWTGKEVIVWGGCLFNGKATNTGGLYNTTKDTWKIITTHNSPSPRTNHIAIWTGHEMFAWGGRTNLRGRLLNSGALYNPEKNEWRPINNKGAPEPRDYFSVVFTGGEIIIWGGRDSLGNFLSSGCAYNLNKGAWRKIKNLPKNEARCCHNSVFAGSTMVVWGGYNDKGDAGQGWCYNIKRNNWERMSIRYQPTTRQKYTFIWAGVEAFVFGGTGDNIKTGYSYSLLKNEWRELRRAVPNIGCAAQAYWDGKEILLFNGKTNEERSTNKVYKYIP